MDEVISGAIFKVGQDIDISKDGAHPELVLVLQLTTIKPLDV